MDKIEAEWKNFRKALRPEEKEAFDELFKKARLHASAAQYQINPDPMESVLFSIILEQQKELHKLERKIDDLCQKKGSTTST